MSTANFPPDETIASLAKTISSGSSSTCSSFFQSDATSKQNRVSACTSVHNMDQTFFQQWQARQQFNRLEQDHDMVPDSIPPFVSQNPYGSFVESQSQHILSDEEFHHILEDQPSRLNHASLQTRGVQRLNYGHHSCPPPQSYSSMGAATATDEIHRIQTPKRPAKKMPTKKGKKTKVVNNDDEGDAEGEDCADRRWTDAEVCQLISLRSEMDHEFQVNAKKQGVHMWDRLHEKMLAACDGFTKSSEACRKKWKVTYRQYCNDKRILNISGEGRKVGGKFFDEIDHGFHNRANVRKLIHGDAQGTPNPCPLDLNEPDRENHPPLFTSETTEDGTLPAQTTPHARTTPQSVKSAKKTSADMYNMYMGDMVSNTSDIAKDIWETTGVLKELNGHISRLIDKL